jgi:Golgi nucleoside diphosphatase
MPHMMSIAICEATPAAQCHSALVQSTLSKKPKLNTKSSTEAELVGIDDILPQALWTKYFMEAQAYGVTTVLNQDNQSTIKLSEDGKATSGKGTRHINIRYFFITDRIARKEVAIQYCPTKQMVADYFTKPLQGVLFYKFCDQIMGVVPMDTITGDHRSVLDVESDDP